MNIIRLNKHFYYIAIALLICAIGSTKAQVNLYVSPRGNDANPGTTDAPFATIAKARDAVRQINGNMTSDIVINLMEGRHKLLSTVELTAQDKGTNGYDIIYKGADNGLTVVSGGVSITGWALHDAGKNIYKATVPAGTNTRQIYVNNQRAIRARSNNAIGWGESGDGYYCPAEVAGWGNITNIEVVSTKEWKLHRGPIASISGSHAIMAQPYWTDAHSQYDVPAAWIENAYELLDSEGEWYLNRSSNTLYYKPRSGETMNTTEVIMPVLETLVSGNGLTNVQFTNITFTHATWLEPSTSQGLPTLQADILYGNKRIPANVRFENCSNMVFSRNNFTHLGGMGLEIGINSHNNVVYNNSFSDISASAISIGNILAYNPSLLAKNNVVSNNLVYDCAVEYKSGVGICVGYSEATRVTQNEVRDLPYTGISAGWGWNNTLEAGKDNEIAFNRVKDVMRELLDGGGIYTLSRNTNAHVNDNYISGVSNRALYPDEGSSYMFWNHNVLDNVKYWASLWTSSIIYDEVRFNFTNQTSELFAGTNCNVSNNTYVTGNNWPAEALAIMRNAGLSKPIVAANANLAIGANAYGSSLYSGYAAVGGIDSNPETLWASDGNESSPYFQVDLGKMTVIDSIVLLPRQNLDQPWVRTNFEIQGSDTHNFYYYTTLGGIDASKGDAPIANNGSWNLKLSTPVVCRYLRVQRINQAGHFNFAEFKVFATEIFDTQSPENSALFKKSNASSTYSSDFKSYWANDGNLQTIFASGTESSPYLQLEQGPSAAFDSIVIVARQDIDQPGSRTNFVIQGSNLSDFSQMTVLGGIDATKGDASFAAYGQWSLKLKSPVNFKCVRVQRINQAGHFTFAEILFFLSNRTAPTVNFQHVDVPRIAGTIEAENYLSIKGAQIEQTTDTGGGQSIGYIAAGAMLEYFVDISAGGTYSVDFRVASESTSGTLKMKVDSKDVGLLHIPNTGSYQTWQTVQLKNITLSPGHHLLQLEVVTNGFNLNWMEFAPNSLTTSNNDIINNQLIVSPNPTTGNLCLTWNGNTCLKNVEILDMMGNVIIQRENPTHQILIDLSFIPDGIYTVVVAADNEIITKKIVKQ